MNLSLPTSEFSRFNSILKQFGVELSDLTLAKASGGGTTISLSNGQSRSTSLVGTIYSDRPLGEFGFSLARFGSSGLAIGAPG